MQEVHWSDIGFLAKPEGVYRKLVDMQQSINKLRDETMMIGE